MRHDTKEKYDAEALFRYGLISEFIHTTLPRGDQRRRMRELSTRKYEVPWQEEPYLVSVYKLNRWLSSYRRHGIEGLRRKVRCDKEVSRALDPFVAARIVAIKKATPSFAIPELIRSLEDQGEVPKDKLRKSTVHRLLQWHGVSGRVGRDPGLKPQRLPFEYPNPMDLWVGDVMHGRFAVQGRKVYLVAFLDDASRAVMHAEFSFDEGALSVLEVFRQALMVRGVCKRVYVDHGSAYVDSRFVRTCAHVGTQLLYAPVRDGAAKAVIERWFGRVRRQFERYLRETDMSGIDSLNSVLWRWIHSTYHQVPHGALNGQSPWQRFMERLPGIQHKRLPADFDFEALWRQREKRTVKRDLTVSLHSHCLEVPPTVTRKKVELRFFEEKLPHDVEVWVEDKMVGKAQPVDKVANISRRRWHPKKQHFTKEPLPLDPLARARGTWKDSEQQ